MKIQLNNPCKAINRVSARISVLSILIENSNGFSSPLNLLKNRVLKSAVSPYLDNITQNNSYFWLILC